MLMIRLFLYKYENFQYQEFAEIFKATTRLINIK